MLSASTNSLAQNRDEIDSVMIRSIYDEVLSNGDIYNNLRSLTKDIGHRLSGSPQASEAMVWGANLLEKYGADTVFVMPVIVPSWTRNNIATATAYMSDGRQIPLHITALGGSVGTPNNSPIRSKIVIVKHLNDLDTMPEAKDKIVLFNRAMDPVLINTGSAYGGANDQRGGGAIAAAKAGAIGSLVRSMTHSLDTLPHTGAMRYEDGVKKIPSAAISTVDARMIAKLYKEDPELEIEFTLNCKALPDVVQGNVIGEWQGSELPNEIITLGGHLDSWDIGEGAHDDGAGIVHTIETLRLLKAVGYTPRRTIRFVLFINEENGNRGGIRYAETASEEYTAGENVYVAAMESDAGGFSPRGFNLDAPDEHYELFKSWQSLFEPYDLYHFKKGWSGVDIGPLKRHGHRPFMVGLKPDGQRYFDFHHSSQDVFENVHKRELELGAGAMASIIMLIDKHLPSPSYE
ncbi:MAG: peptidase M28 family protein [Crocinitomicaceae bacterium]|nr:peptidase M28 family protein [Crocinitomicaceae bacterium]